MQPNIAALINEFASKLAKELAQLPASELVKLGESAPRRGRPAGTTTRAPSGGNGTVTVDKVVEIVKQRDEPVSAEAVATLLNAKRASVSEALKEAVAAHRLQREGKARGTTYRDITIQATPEMTSEPQAPAIQTAREIAKRRGRGSAKS